ncbi:MAG TPA: hypothetical protein VM687_16490 [Stenotrophomonas sp.]|nr:hypothetical protein [Stenotrophomonas sp.]
MSPAAAGLPHNSTKAGSGIRYTLMEDDYSRLHQAWEVLDMLSMLSEGMGTAISLDHVAAVSGYAARDLNAALANLVRSTPSP